MLTVIRSLKPYDELSAGIKFFELLLERDGTKGVIEWTKKAREILAQEGELKGYDFEGALAQLAERANPDLGTRRKFLHTSAWLITGGVFTLWGAARSADQLAGYMTGDDDAHKPKEPLPRTHWARRVFQSIEKVIDDHLMGTAELLVGVALMNEFFVNRDEIRYDEISNAVAEFGTLMDKDKTLPPPRRGRASSR